MIHDIYDQVTFHNATTDECRNSILMMHHYPDLGSASDWLCCVGNLLQSIKSTTQIWVETCHQYVISVIASWTSFRRESQWWRRKMLVVFSCYPDFCNT